ncbi:class I SAM-dependent methyltransferase [Enterocloster lavalensis]|uniref:class I SAM-dependent methyltransferase n=2 Tax=Enterocloster lavalensis TaxID=460384 RepID=UPI0023F2A126|nr:class I SAM-dependent methyltransferase [Enterocloster lavalensis]
MESTKEFQEETRRYFDRLAKDYDDSCDGRFVRCMYREVIRRAVSLPGDRVLDLGCGNGNLIRMLGEVKQVSCWGADLSPQMIREAGKNLGEGVNLAVADAASLPYGDGQFDIVICNASFHHYTEPERAVEEIRRVLRTGGTLILGDPTIPGRLARKLLNQSVHKRDSGDFKIYGKAEITSLFSTRGFRVHSWKRINYRSFVFEAEKILNFD